MANKKKPDDIEFVDAPPAAEPSAETAPIESWAERKGMLPQFTAGNAAMFGAGARPNPEYWKFAAAKAFKGWSEGHVVTEQEFETAVAEQMAQVHR